MQSSLGPALPLLGRLIAQSCPGISGISQHAVASDLQPQELKYSHVSDDGTLTAEITADAPHCDHDAVPFDLQPQMPNGNGQLPAGNGPFSSHYVGNMDERAAHSESHSANNDSNAQAFHSQEEHPRSSYASSDAIRGSRQSSPVQQNISNSASQPGLEFKLCQDPDPMHYDPSIQVNVISEKINQFQPEIGAL